MVEHQDVPCCERELASELLQIVLGCLLVPIQNWQRRGDLHPVPLCLWPAALGLGQVTRVGVEGYLYVLSDSAGCQDPLPTRRLTHAGGRRGCEGAPPNEALPHTSGNVPASVCAWAPSWAAGGTLTLVHLPSHFVLRHSFVSGCGGVGVWGCGGVGVWVCGCWVCGCGGGCGRGCGCGCGRGCGCGWGGGVVGLAAVACQHTAEFIASQVPESSSCSFNTLYFFSEHCNHISCSRQFMTSPLAHFLPSLCNRKRTTTGNLPCRWALPCNNSCTPRSRRT